MGCCWAGGVGIAGKQQPNSNMLLVSTADVMRPGWKHLCILIKMERLVLNTGCGGEGGKEM